MDKLDIKVAVSLHELEVIREALFLAYQRATADKNETLRTEIARLDVRLLRLWDIHG